MSNNQIVWEGLDELKKELQSLPADLAAEASGIVTAAAQGAKDDIVNAYPNRTGDLRNHVTIGSGVNVGRFGASVVVKNTSKLAYIFENGTQARHTALGANRGSMPPGHVFIPRIISRRKAMYEQLKALLVSHGLAVSGDAG